MNNKIDESAAMDALQDHGLISDLCESIDGVPDYDSWKAIKFLSDKKKFPVRLR